MINGLAAIYAVLTILLERSKNIGIKNGSSLRWELPFVMRDHLQKRTVRKGNMRNSAFLQLF